MTCPECQYVMSENADQCVRCGWDIRAVKFQQGPMRVMPKMSNLLIVHNVNKVERRGIYHLQASLSTSEVASVYALETADPEAPDIRIWDLDNIQNGEPIPPTIIEKLKEMVNSAPVE